MPESEVDQARLLDLADQRHNVVHLGCFAGEGVNSPVKPVHKLARGAPLSASDEIQCAFGAKHHGFRLMVGGRTADNRFVGVRAAGGFVR